MKAYFTVTTNTKVGGGAETGVDRLLSVFEDVVCIIEVV